MMEDKIPSRAVWWCLSVYCIVDIVRGCGSVAAVPQEDSELPLRLVVRREEYVGRGEGGRVRH